MTKLIIDVGTTEIIERELNAEELAQQAIDESKLSIKEAEAEAKAVARQAILDRLGLTEDEARLLLG
jgi:hypothetical protein